MTTLSVAVVGAGPAGSSVARLLALQGARVSLYEARHLPRPKACGGGLTPKAQRLVPTSVLPAIERRIHRVELRGSRLSPVRMTVPEAEVAMVERSTFDLAMAEAAAGAGVDVRDGQRVGEVLEDDRGVTLMAHGRCHRVDVLVAADGEPSGIARQLGLVSPPVRRSFALQLDTHIASSVTPDTAILYLNVPGGYTWYFPKDGHANVGVVSSRLGTVDAIGGMLKLALERFLDDLDLGAENGRVTGHWIPQALRGGTLATRRVVLVGDAAAAADPLFGEGIAFAMYSAAMASLAVTDLESGASDDLRAYESRLRTGLRPPLRRLRLAAAVADRSPTIALAALRLSPWVRSYAVDVVSGRGRPFALE